MKAATSYFRVVNLEKYQHYKHRNPPWIKLHASTLEDYDFARLQDACKMHLCAIWLLASRTENKIPWDTEWIATRINATSKVDLNALQAAGFIELTGDASNTRATRKQSALSETENRDREQSTEVERISRSVVKEKNQKTPLPPTDRLTTNGYKPTLKDARDLQVLMLRRTGKAETDETTLGWLKATSSAGSFTRIKQVLELKMRKGKPNSNAWFKTVLQDQFGSSPAEAAAQRKDLQERLQQAITIQDNKLRSVEVSRCMEEAKDNGITLLGNPFA